MSKSRTWYVGLQFAGLTMLLLVAPPADAQRRGLGGMRPGNVNAAQLICSPAAQAELQLTDEQKAKAAAIHETLTTGRRKLFAEVPKEGGQRAPKVAKLTQQAASAIDEMLDENQRKRLGELLLQANGAASLEDPEVRTALNISAEQQQKLDEISRANAQARREAREASYNSTTPAATFDPLELHRQAEQKLLDVLTPEQRRQFDEMQGKKIALDLFAS